MQKFFQPSHETEVSGSYRLIPEPERTLGRAAWKGRRAGAELPPEPQRKHTLAGGLQPARGARR